MSQFTPYSALAGGALIGLSAALFLLLTGRRAGISGIVGGLLSPACADPVWRLCFMAGLILGPLAIHRAGWFPVAIRIEEPFPLLASAGFLVGYGTSLGSGCTSGHGICGLARFSRRSLAAMLAFMLSGGVTVAFVRHVLEAGR